MRRNGVYSQNVGKISFSPSGVAKKRIFIFFFQCLQEHLRKSLHSHFSAYTSRHPSIQLRVTSTHWSGWRNLERLRWANWKILFSKDSSSSTESVLLLWLDPFQPNSEKACDNSARSTAPTKRSIGYQDYYCANSNQRLAAVTHSSLSSEELWASWLFYMHHTWCHSSHLCKIQIQALN